MEWVKTAFRRSIITQRFLNREYLTSTSICFFFFSFKFWSGAKLAKSLFIFTAYLIICVCENVSNEKNICQYGTEHSLAETVNLFYGGGCQSLPFETRSERLFFQQLQGKWTKNCSIFVVFLNKRDKQKIFKLR